MNPEEAIELGLRLGRPGWMTFNPLMAGIAADEAWKMLRLVDEPSVTPRVGFIGLGAVGD